jgi:hypothetical protein
MLLNNDDLIDIKPKLIDLTGIVRYSGESRARREAFRRYPGNIIGLDTRLRRYDVRSLPK